MTEKNNIDPQLWDDIEAILIDGNVDDVTIKRIEEHVYSLECMLEAFKRLPIDKQRHFVNLCMMNYAMD